MKKRLLAFRLMMIGFIIFNFIVSFRLENEAACLIMFLNFLLALGYLVAEMIMAREGVE